MEPKPDFRHATKVIRDSQREKRRKRQLTYARETTLATIPQALGTIIGGIVLILLAQAFGIVTSLDGGDVALLLAILTGLLGVGTGAIAWADRRDVARTEAALHDAYKVTLDMAKKRQAEVDEMMREDSEESS